MEAAKKEHDKEIPVDIIKKFRVPDVKSIVWIPVQTLQEAGAKPGHRATAPIKDDALRRAIETDGSALPFFVEYDHVKVSNAIGWSHSLLTACLVGLRHHFCIPLVGKYPEPSSLVTCVPCGADTHY